MIKYHLLHISRWEVLKSTIHSPLQFLQIFKTQFRCPIVIGIAFLHSAAIINMSVLDKVSEGSDQAPTVAALYCPIKLDINSSNLLIRPMTSSQLQIHITNTHNGHHQRHRNHRRIRHDIMPADTAQPHQTNMS